MINNTIDSLSLNKHKFLKILYEKGEINTDNGRFLCKDFSFDELKAYMSGIDIQILTKSLLDSKDIEDTAIRIRITMVGAGSYTHKKYLNEYRKSIFEYIKNLFQIAIFATTIIFLVIDRFIYKPKFDKIEKTVIKLESENETLKQFMQSKINKNKHRDNYCDSTKKEYNKSK